MPAYIITLYGGDPYWCFYAMYQHQRCSTMIKYKGTYKQFLIMLYPQYYREVMHRYAQHADTYICMEEYADVSSCIKLQCIVHVFQAPARLHHGM